MKRPDFTLSSGPTMMSPAAHAAMAMPVTYHYDPWFLAVYRRLEDDLRVLFGTGGDVVLMPGEAALGLEAALTGVAKPASRALALISGPYGQWMADILTARGVDVAEVRVPFDESVTPQQVADAVGQGGPFDVMVMVHSESGCGTINPLGEIAAIARANDILLVVDAVGSVGGSPVAVDEWGIDICVTGPQKCLGGPMGVSLMTVSARAWSFIEANEAAPRHSYISLLDYREQWIRSGHFPSAPPVSEILGTAAVCSEARQEGLERLVARHRTAAEACRAGVGGMGLDLWPKEPAMAAPNISAVRIPDHVSASELCAHVRRVYGVLIVDGGSVGNLVRIGHMGETARGMYPVVGVVALGQGLVDMGVDVALGAGVEAATKVLSHVNC